jgi:electron transfer flavoprotein beta subunit
VNIVVCVRRVPDLTEAEVSIDKSGKDIDKRDLIYDINEWDSYAVEAAVLLKESQDATVTAITLGDEDDEEVLRRCLALGADEAIRLDDPAFAGSDGYATAVALAAAIRPLPYDLVLTGALASDNGWGQVGATVAQLLGIPHATLVTSLDVEGEQATVTRELEGGIEEKLAVRLPALFTIQTGINEPRYVSIAGIRRVSRHEIPVQGVGELGLSVEAVGASGALVEIESMSLPEETQKGEILQGSVDATTGRLTDIFSSKGWLG